MKKNMRTADKIFRLIIALAIGVLYLANIISGTLALVLGILAIVFIATSFVSFCPLYLTLGINTVKKTNERIWLRKYCNC